MKRALIALMLSGPSCLAAEPPLRDSIAGVLAGGELDEARIEQVEALFDGAPARGDAASLAHLDAAAALANAGRFDLAEAHLVRADFAAERDAVRVAARFNLGQLRYSRAVSMLKPEGKDARPDPDGAKAMLARAAEAFRSVLDIAPADAEAARDVERVRRLIDAIDKMQEEAKKQAEQMRKQAEQLDRLADRQQQESMQNQQQTQDEEKAKRDQSDISNETKQQSEQTEPDAAKKALQDAMRRQQEASERLDKGDQQAAADAQKKAAESLREAADALRQEADKKEGKQGEQNEQDQQQGEQGDQQKNEDQKEGQSRDDRLTEWLLDREKRQREQRDRQLRALLGRPAPVEKDW
ncbi:MAG TPA: hypothetical protein ENK11_03845 [Phycisphaerales bacterium]|nr:hypothetical protein [Phycisphaerales bacterium]